MSDPLAPGAGMLRGAVSLCQHPGCRLPVGRDACLGDAPHLIEVMLEAQYPKHTRRGGV